jgi:hypothetical protein
MPVALPLTHRRAIRPPIFAAFSVSFANIKIRISCAEIADQRTPMRKMSLGHAKMANFHPTRLMFSLAT